MKTLSRRSTGRTMLAGAGTIAIDHHIRVLYTMPSAAKALAGDWKAVGDDLRRAMNQVEREHEAA